MMLSKHRPVFCLIRRITFRFFLVQGTKKICTVSGRKDSEYDDESDDNPTKDENKIEENSLEEWLYFRRLKIKLYRDNLN